MSILVKPNTDIEGISSTKDSGRRDPMFGDLYRKAKGNMQLLLIYKKIEIAAETGDWSLMNELYGEFKSAYSMN